MPQPNVIFQNESRPDLAAGLVRSALLGGVRFIASLVMPAINFAEKAGQFSVARVISGSSTKNRTAGTNLTGTRVDTKDIPYSCDKFESRSFVNEKDIKNFGGVDPATAAATRVSGMAVINDIETATAALIFNTTTYATAITLDDTNPIATLAQAAIKVKEYGRAALVCSESWLLKFIKLPQVLQLLKDFYGNGVFQFLEQDLSTISTGVGASFGVNIILKGDDKYWNVAGFEDAAAVIAIRPEMENDAMMTAKALPCFAATATFLPDMAKAEELFFCDTVYLPGSKENAVDVTAYLQPMILNAGGCQLVKFAAVAP